MGEKSTSVISMSGAYVSGLRPTELPVSEASREKSRGAWLPWTLGGFVRTYLVHVVKALGEHRKVVGQKHVVVFLTVERVAWAEKQRKVRESIQREQLGKQRATRS